MATDTKITVAIAGGSGYGGGELVRLLLDHPNVEIAQVTSERFAGKLVSKVHPNLRGATNLKFCKLGELATCDLLFLSLPHGHAMERIVRDIRALHYHPLPLRRQQIFSGRVALGLSPVE